MKMTFSDVMFSERVTIVDMLCDCDDGKSRKYSSRSLTLPARFRKRSIADKPFRKVGSTK